MSTGSLTTPDLDEQDTQAAEARDAAVEEPTSEAAEVSSFTSTVPTRRTPARAPNGRFVGAGGQVDEDELPADRYLERELSWLQFNERVLQLAMDPAVPLLERDPLPRHLRQQPRRVLHGAGRRAQAAHRDRPGGPHRGRLEPRELLERIARLAHELMQQHAGVFQHDVRPSLEDEGISVVRWDDLDEDDREPLHYFFADRVFPVLTPLAVDPAHPFPYISGPVAQPRRAAAEPEDRAPSTSPGSRCRRACPASSSSRRTSTPRSSASASSRSRTSSPATSTSSSPGMLVQEHFSFRVTRNEDLEVEEDDAENLLTALEKELTRRRFGPPIRLEVEEDIDPKVLDMLARELQISDREIYRLPTPLDLRGLFTIADVDRSDLEFPKFFPRTHPDFAPTESAKAIDLLTAVRQKDVLVQHPYNSFSTSVQAFIEQAAGDPKVLAIKQTLYRTSGDSPDRRRRSSTPPRRASRCSPSSRSRRASTRSDNISLGPQAREGGRPRRLRRRRPQDPRQAVRSSCARSPSGLVRYCHIGTGNYNPKTARIYEDFGLFTTDPQVGEDLSRLFNLLSGFAHEQQVQAAARRPAAPCARACIDLIDEEIELHESRREGAPSGRIVIKANSIVDEALIDALYRASIAGVRVDIWVRGICALRPGVEGLSENIRVRSILGRFLEHSRVFSFDHGGDPQVYIGSADMMHRNLDRRVEALVRIAEPSHLVELADLIDLAFAETTSRWDLGSDGRWVRHHLSDSGEPLDDLQEKLIERHDRRRRKARRR